MEAATTRPTGSQIRSVAFRLVGCQFVFRFGAGLRAVGASAQGRPRRLVGAMLPRPWGTTPAAVCEKNAQSGPRRPHRGTARAVALATQPVYRLTFRARGGLVGGPPKQKRFSNARFVVWADSSIMYPNITPRELLEQVARGDRPIATNCGQVRPHCQVSLNLVGRHMDITPALPHGVFFRAVSARFRSVSAPPLKTLFESITECPVS